ncbi:MAG: DNA repair protein RecO [Oscillospiraceae bacterium]|nr:DNA repair protein RecO [Oscillospiraceae bacterium]
MALIKAQGLVIKSTNFGEASKILTVLTREFGKIQVAANNVRRGKFMRGAQIFSYSNFALFKGQKSLYRMNDVDCVEFFDPLRGDLEKLSYANYFADIACNITGENNEDERLLSLLLNSLHLLCRDTVSAKKIKVVFELRSMTAAGFMPDFSGCCDCRTERNIASFDLVNGTVRCGNCIKVAPNIAEINDTLRAACLYITQADMNKIFSFDMPDELLDYLSGVTERYAAIHIDKRLQSLEYLKKILGGV